MSRPLSSPPSVVDTAVVDTAVVDTAVVDLLGQVGAPAGWLALVGLLLAVAVAASIGVADDQERIVVRRLGRVVRVRGPGLVARIPLVEQATTISLRPFSVEPILVRAVSRDGVCVRMSGTATVAVADPVRVTVSSTDPIMSAARTVEAALREDIARTDLVDLLGARLASGSRARLALDERLEAAGLKLIDLEPTEVDLELTHDLVRWARSLTDTGSR